MHTTGTYISTKGIRYHIHVGWREAERSSQKIWEVKAEIFNIAMALQKEGNFFCTTAARLAGTGGSSGGGKGWCSNSSAGRAWGQSKEVMSFQQKTLLELSYWARMIILTERLQRAVLVKLSNPGLQLWKNKSQEARPFPTNWTQTDCSCWNT